MKKQKTVNVELRVPPHVADFIHALARQGVLGSTAEEVVIHMLRQHLFEVVQANSPKQEQGR